MKTAKLKLTIVETSLLISGLMQHMTMLRNVARAEKWRDSELAMSLGEVQMLITKIQQAEAVAE